METRKTYSVTALDNSKQPNYTACGHKHKTLLAAVKCGLNLSVQGRFYHWGVMCNDELVSDSVLDNAIAQIR